MRRHVGRAGLFINTYRRHSSLVDIHVDMKKGGSLGPAYPINLSNRGERIRTSGLLRPRQARYQAALRPDKQEVHCASFDIPLQ
jgi:hypothetical protein